MNQSATGAGPARWLLGFDPSRLTRHATLNQTVIVRIDGPLGRFASAPGASSCAAMPCATWWRRRCARTSVTPSSPTRSSGTSTRERLRRWRRSSTRWASPRRAHRHVARSGGRTRRAPRGGGASPPGGSCARSRSEAGSRPVPPGGVACLGVPRRGRDRPRRTSLTGRPWLALLGTPAIARSSTEPLCRRSGRPSRCDRAARRAHARLRAGRRCGVAGCRPGSPSADVPVACRAVRLRRHEISVAEEGGNAAVVGLWHLEVGVVGSPGQDLDRRARHRRVEVFRGVEEPVTVTHDDVHR